ncbi:Nuclear receptor 2C2-associated protein [Blattella germanica]|nr:Nuclear receptor 2C2-associated protein [Blattella germanica]
MTSILKQGEFSCRVSSVLNKDVKQFGKKYLFDGNDETCWNSDQGSPQWITLDLEKEEIIETFLIQFQGGFVGHDCYIEAKLANGMQIMEPFYPEDINSLQIFKLKEAISSKQIKIVFNESTDFFGRIVIYKLDVLSPSR